MDFEDYALGGVGAGAGLALGGGVIGKYIGNKWGEDAYYRSKARSLGKESDASIDYDQQSRALLESNLPEKKKIRELQKLKVQRDRIIGDSTRNRESDAEVSRWLNRAKGIGAGTLGAGAVGGAIGLGYGLNNDFSGDKQHFANFNNYDSLALGTLGLTTGLLAPIALDLKYNKYSPEEQSKVDKSEKYLNTLRYRLNKKYPPSNDSASNDKEYYNEFYNLSDKYLDKSGAKEIYRKSSNKSNIATGLGLAAGVAGGVGGVVAGQHIPEYLHSFNKNNKNMTKFTRNYNSTYIQFKRAYNQAVAEFGVLDAIRGSSVKQRLGAGAGLAGLAGGGLLAYKALRGETPDIDFEGLRQQAEGYGGQAGKYLGGLREQGQQYIDGNENISNLREQGKVYGAKAGKYLTEQGGSLRDKISSRVPLPPQWNGDYQSPVGIPQSLTGEEVGYSPRSIGSYNDYQAPVGIPQSLTGQQDNSRLYHATKILRESGRNRYQG